MLKKMNNVNDVGKRTGGKQAVVLQQNIEEVLSTPENGEALVDMWHVGLPLVNRLAITWIAGKSAVCDMIMIK